MEDNKRKGEEGINKIDEGEKDSLRKGWSSITEKAKIKWITRKVMAPWSHPYFFNNF